MIYERYIVVYKKEVRSNLLWIGVIDKNLKNCFEVRLGKKVHCISPRKLPSNCLGVTLTSHKK